MGHFLRGLVLLLVLNIGIYLITLMILTRYADLGRRCAIWSSYGCVILGALWVCGRIFIGSGIPFSAIYLDAFMIGVLSGCQYLFFGFNRSGEKGATPAEHDRSCQ